jgi:hypothetical protein
MNSLLTTPDEEQIRSAFKEKGTDIQNNEIVQKCSSLCVNLIFEEKRMKNKYEY